MSDPQEQLTFEQLPPWVRERFEAMRRRLNSVQGEINMLPRLKDLVFGFEADWQRW